MDTKDTGQATDTHDTMVNRDTIINNRSGFPLVQWLALMLTVIGMGIGSLVYITSMKQDIALNRRDIDQVRLDQTRFETQTLKDQTRFETQLIALQKLVSDGMVLRIQLQGDVKNVKDTLTRIEQKIDSHMENGKQISSIKSGPDFRP